MEDFSAFTKGERALIEALTRHGVRFGDAVGDRIHVVAHMHGSGRAPGTAGGARSHRGRGRACVLNGSKANHVDCRDHRPLA